MRVIIAGSRSITSMGHLLKAVQASGFAIHALISGGADGADKLAEQYASLNGLPITVHLAKWHVHGQQAGKIRNVRMAFEGDALIALWDGKSPGTRHMINTARRMGLPVHVHRTDLELA